MDMDIRAFLLRLRYDFVTLARLFTLNLTISPHTCTCLVLFSACKMEEKLGVLASTLLRNSWL